MFEKTMVSTRGYPRRTRRSAMVMALSLLSLMLFIAPVGAAPSGTVDATITVEGPCITLPTIPIDFGPVGFSQIASNTVDIAGSFFVANCASGQTQEIYAQASAASGSGTGAWTVNQWDGSALMCALGSDIFAAGLRRTGDLPWVWLSSTADTLVYTSALFSATVTPSVVMPCSGSSGVGETMTFTYTLTATLP